MPMTRLYAMNGKICTCGREHSFSAEVHCGAGATQKLPDILRERNIQKPYI